MRRWLLCSWPEPCPGVRYRLNGKRLSAARGQRERPNRPKNASGMVSDIRPGSAPAPEEAPDQGPPALYLPRRLRYCRRVSSVSARSGRTTLLLHVPGGRSITRIVACGLRCRLSAHRAHSVSRSGTQSDTQSQTSAQSRHSWWWSGSIARLVCEIRAVLATPLMRTAARGRFRSAARRAARASRRAPTQGFWPPPAPLRGNLPARGQ